jgi:hypothetical protein
MEGKVSYPYINIKYSTTCNGRQGVWSRVGLDLDLDVFDVTTL